MNEKIVKLGDALMACTTEEVLELQKYLESKGLVIAAPVSVAAESTKEEVVEESANVHVVLKSTTLNAVKLVKPIMAYTNTGAMQTKKLLDELPTIICENVTRDAGKAAIANLTNEFGDAAVFELQDC